jgi:hypothetical protein
MTQELANQIISEAFNVALLKGCFGLIEASNIVRAIDFLSSQNELPVVEEKQLPPLPITNHTPWQK